MQDRGAYASMAGKLGELGGYQKLLDLFKVGKRGANFKCPIPVLCWSIKTMLKVREIGFKE